MKIRLLTGELKGEEQSLQLPAEVDKYAGRDNHSIKDFNATPHGVPAGGQYTVDISYDARMINTVEINSIIYQQSFGGDSFPLLDTMYPPLPGGDTSNTVPFGYIFVIRRVGNLTTIISGTGTMNNLICNHYITGSIDVQINKSSIKTGDIASVSGAMTDTWIIVDEGQSIACKIAGYFYGTPQTDWSYSVSIYGHLIEKSRASQLVIANETERRGDIPVSVVKGTL